MTILQLVSEATGSRWQIWPQADPVPPGEVQEGGRYLFELTGCAKAAAAELLLDDQPLEALRSPASDTARWRWTPGFHAGTVEAELRLPSGSVRRFEIITDPDRRKLTRDEFDAMVREILDDTFALFALNGFRKSVARGAGSRPPAIARLEFLRSRIAELEEIVMAIARHPRRRLAADETAVPYHRAGRVTGPEILRSLRAGRILKEQSVPGRLPAALQGFLPEKIRVRRQQNSLDLQEHRQMGACLRAWAAWLTTVAGTLEARQGADGEVRDAAATWTRRCRQLSRRITQMAQAAPFAEAGEAPARLMLSSLFRSDPAYRRFYRLAQDMNLGIAAVFGDFLSLPLARTYELYELWCFLRLVRAGVEEFGPSWLAVGDLFITDAAGSVTIASGAVTVRVGPGWTLSFQKQYQEFWLEPDGRGSYSRTMIPDVVVAQDGEGANPGRVIVLDAKYRIDSGLNDALSSIHAYRDALVQAADDGGRQGFVTAAYLLAPHLPLLRADWQATPLPGRLFHPQYRAGFQFGAMTLRPGMSIPDIAAALRLIVADATRQAA